jgi:hypothetical protein
MTERLPLLPAFGKGIRSEGQVAPDVLTAKVQFLRNLLYGIAAKLVKGEGRAHERGQAFQDAKEIMPDVVCVVVLGPESGRVPSLLLHPDLDGVIYGLEQIGFTVGSDILPCHGRHSVESVSYDLDYLCHALVIAGFIENIALQLLRFESIRQSSGSNGVRHVFGKLLRIGNVLPFPLRHGFAVAPYQANDIAGCCAIWNDLPGACENFFPIDRRVRR